MKFRTVFGAWNGIRRTSMSPALVLRIAYGMATVRLPSLVVRHAGGRIASRARGSGESDPRMPERPRTARPRPPPAPGGRTVRSGRLPRMPAPHDGNGSGRHDAEKDGKVKNRHRSPPRRRNP
ncbi:hypothetical protein GCM10017667_24990 [Streptomyces filamentosus]|uniref:Uncharacterized protein n=1 Tax=Streptomyces filamentosus TaxID=67294 RepID=A0A919BJU0_STRFL|nr:hypothetical protein GCM10017667_24990 [Streptomyces filamentosus]